MRIVYDKFGGIQPKLDPDLLPPNNAQTAHNCILDSGKLAPYMESSIDSSLGYTYTEAIVSGSGTILTFTSGYEAIGTGWNRTTLPIIYFKYTSATTTLEIFSNSGMTALVAHTSVGTTTGIKSLIADNASGWSGTIMVDLPPTSWANDDKWSVTATLNTDRNTIYKYKFNGNSLVTGALATTPNASMLAITNGTFKVTIDVTEYTIVGINLSQCVTYVEMAYVIQQAIRDATKGAEIVVWDSTNKKFIIATSQASISFMSDGEISDGATNVIPLHSEYKGYSFVEGGPNTAKVSGYDKITGWMNNPRITMSYSTTARTPAGINSITFKNTDSGQVIGYTGAFTTTGNEAITPYGASGIDGTIDIDVVPDDSDAWTVVASKADIVSASNELNTTTNVAWKAVDTTGTTTEWKTSALTSGVDSAYWQIEFERKYAINKFKIYNGTASEGNSLSVFTLQGSNDGTVWSIIEAFTNNNVTSGASYEFTVTAPKSFKYYRINITERNGGAYYYLAKVEFWHLPVNMATSTYLLGKSADGATRSTYSTSEWLSWTSADVDVVRSLTDEDNWERIYWTGDSDHIGKLVVKGVLPNAPMTREINLEAPLGVGTVTPTPLSTLDPTATITAEKVSDGSPATISTATTRTSTGYSYWCRAAYAINNMSIATGVGTFTFPTSVVGTALPVTYNNATIGTLTLTSWNGDGTATNSATASLVWVNGGERYFYYMMSYVNDLGEEGPLSPISLLYQTKNDEVIVMTDIEVPVAGTTLYPKKRIYRSATGTTTSSFRFLVELDSDVTTYTDMIPDAGLGEVMPQRENPPDNLRGLTTMPGNFAVAFKGREVWFSDVGLMHSFPSKYMQTVESDIVGLCTSGNDLYVLTNEYPYLASGNTPESMYFAKLALAQPCVAKRGIKRMGSTVMFPSNDGLIALTGGVGKVITDNIYSWQQWRALSPELIIAEVDGMKYYAFGMTHATQKCIIFDGSNVTTNSEVAKGTFEDLSEGQMYLITGSNIMKFEGSTTPKTLTWTSKEYHDAYPNAMVWFRVIPKAYNVNVTINMYAEGTLVATKTVTAVGAYRFPITRRERKHYYEIVSTTGIDNLVVAQSAKELQTW